MSSESTSGSRSTLALVATARGEVALIVVDVGDAAAHACGKVAAGGTENDGEAVGHVFAAMIADALDNGVVAPELRTAKRSPAMPLRKTSPLVSQVESDHGNVVVPLGLDFKEGGKPVHAEGLANVVLVKKRRHLENHRLHLHSEVGTVKAAA